MRGPSATNIRQSRVPNAWRDLLDLFDKDETPRAGLTVSADGASALVLNDKENLRATLFADADGSPGMFFYDKDGELRAGLKVRADGSPSLTLFDGKGKVLWKAPR